MTERFSRTLLRCAARITPRLDRARWREEWSAEMTHAWHDRPGGVGRRAELTMRTVGLLRHAIWMRIDSWRMAGVRQDLTGACRFARRRPAFTALAVLTVALGIGANTTIFSFVNAVFFRPVAVSHPESLVSLFTSDTSYQGHLLPVSYLNYVDYRDSHVFQDLAAEVRLDLNIGDGTAPPARVPAASVTANYFDVLGVRALVGRTFAPGEDTPVDAHAVVVLSAHLWRERFGGRPGIVGTTVAVNGMPYTVIGVASDGFRGATLLSAYDLWVPIGQRRGIVGFLDRWFGARQAAMCAVYGRLRSPGDLDRAAVATRTVSETLASAYPRENHARRTIVVPLVDAAVNPNQRGQVVRLGWFLGIVVALVLALACTNVANLLLLRALSRRREIAVRIATGASRARLVRQLLTESLLLASAGGALGMILALAGRRLLWSFKPPSVPDTLVVPFDQRVWIVTLAATILTGVIFGIVPALQATRTDLTTALKGTEPRTMGRRIPLRHVLVVGQVALSLLILVGTGLLLRSLERAERVDPGIAAAHLVTVNMNPDSVGYDRPRALALFRRVLDTVQAMPGIRRAAFAFNKPLTPAISALFYLEGKDVPSPASGAPIATNAADPGYFDTVGISVQEGRTFTPADTEESTPSIVINEALRDRYFSPGESPLGRHMRFVDVPTAFEIVGVASDAAYAAIGEETPNYLYYPFTQAYGAGEVTLYVRTRGEPGPLVDTIRRTVQALDPGLPLYNVGVVSDAVTASLWAPRAGAALLGFFGALGLVLAAVGTYGVMSYQVDESRREIGVRMALGEGHSSIVRRIVGRSLGLVGAGLAIGIAAALATTHFMATFLYGLSSTDFVTFAITPLLLAVAALVATIIPARRATRVDPLRVLRSE